MTASRRSRPVPRPRTMVAGLLASAAVTTVVLTALPARASSVQPLPPVSSADAKKQAVLVDAEDIRLRTMFERFGVLTKPTLVETAGSLPTVLLPARAEPYTVAEVISAGGGRREVDGAVLFTANVLVGPQARLVVSSLAGDLRLASGPSGFATVAAWRGAMEFVGASPDRKLRIVGWDVQNLRPDTTTVDGRSYIRTMGGELIVRNVDASSLGFWTGRTGGIAWTGSKGEPSTGGAADSVFRNNIYGAYISGSEGIQMIDVRLEDNERSGLGVHRDATGTLISGVTAARNHGDGMTIDRASGSRVMRSTVTDNSGDGITVDGRGLGVVATATGVQVNQIKDTLIESNTVSGNGRYGIRVVGGENSVVRANNVSGSQVGIIVKSGANGTQITDNKVNGSSETGIQVGPDARRTAMVNNTITESQRGIVVQDATTNILSRNQVTGAKDFAITIRGQATDTKIQNNTLAGRGWRAIDIRKALGMSAREVRSNNTGGWVSLKPHHWYTLIEQHPALLVWGLVVLLPVFGWWSRRRARKRPASHPYPESELLLRRMTDGTMRPRSQQELIMAAARDRAATGDRVPEPVRTVPRSRTPRQYDVPVEQRAVRGPSRHVPVDSEPTLMSLRVQRKGPPGANDGTHPAPASVAGPGQEDDSPTDYFTPRMSTQTAPPRPRDAESHRASPDGDPPSGRRRWRD
ncbi:MULTISPECIES: right-handed parallel beta-helix repeat-containing protein [unclassified Pseudofrankia]|uniref:right-handed parallel beta-helix repeat-containing protein n=1 Tax=unclassified Pseudofrankia TaxID=2994372 RepID=UPI0009F24C3D|nr:MULTISPECIES: right-handed parallel beta-helix repeat-containing protein [unclassified Pseudofrankia]MDT3446299.1 right-handed parallel beta-helix repeat-containing protein [Pseudofrankia sp. BMG5.37]